MRKWENDLIYYLNLEKKLSRVSLKWVADVEEQLKIDGRLELVAYLR
jgi:hypothetical protein